MSLDPYASIATEDTSVDPYAEMAEESLVTEDPYADVSVDINTYVEEEESKLTSLLPETLNMAGFDMEVDPETAAFFVGAGGMMLDTYRGVKQLLGSEEDKEEERFNQVAINKLYGDERYGSFTTAGAITGALAEPLGFLIPAAKGKNLVKAVGVGAVTGATFGATGYVDEAEGQTRMGNMMIGATLGGGIAATIKGVGAGAKAIGRSDVVQKHQIKSANNTLDKYELEWAKQIAQGKTPTEARVSLLEANPRLGSKVKGAFDKTKRVPHTLLTQAEAKQVVAIDKSTKKPLDIVLGDAKDGVAAVFKGVDTVGGVISTRIKQKSPAAWKRLRDYEYAIRSRPHELLQKTDGFRDMYDELPKLQKSLVDSSLLNGDYDEVSRIYKTLYGDDGIRSVQGVKDILINLGDELVVYDRITKPLNDYFPRFISNKKGMLKALDKAEFGNKILDVLKKAETKKGKLLTALEESDIINKQLRTVGRGIKAGPGFTKGRKFDRVPPEFMQFYSNPIESLHSYINNSIIDIEKAKFFGKGYTKAKHYSGSMDLHESIGGLMRKELKDANMSASDMSELASLFEARFGIGETAPIRAIQHAKNIMYAMLLGNPVSAATQLGDIPISVWSNGFKPAMQSVAESLTGRSKFTVKDFGMVDKLAEEFTSTTGSAKLLNKALRYSGFEGVDRLGKATAINSAYKKYTTLFQLDPSSKDFKKGFSEFADKYQAAYGGDFAKVINDFKVGNVTDDVKALLFSELLDLQPAAMSEMSEAWLRNPNLRLTFAFKTFMLKQIDVIRRGAYDEIKKGNVAKGFGRLFSYGMLIGAGNSGAQYVKDAMTGKEIDPMPSDLVVNLTKTLGYSEYIANKAAEGKPIEAAIDYTLSPIKVYDQLMSNPEEAIKYMPIVGRLYYQWFGGGIEKDLEKEYKREYKEEFGKEYQEE